MDITLNCKVINVKELQIKKGENKGKTFAVAHFYDGENLQKLSIPEKYKERVMSNIGKDIKVNCSLNLDTKKLYFKDIA